jgi:hypothetical protein
VKQQRVVGGIFVGDDVACSLATVYCNLRQLWRRRRARETLTNRLFERLLMYFGVGFEVERLLNETGEVAIPAAWLMPREIRTVILHSRDQSADAIAGFVSPC